MENSEGWLELKTVGGYAPIPASGGTRRCAISDLPDADRIRLTTLLARSDFMEGVEPAEQDLQVRDGQTHVLTISVNGREHSVKIHDPVRNRTLADLLGFVRRVLAE